MISTLTRNWWAVALRGVIAVVFGALALLRPDVTLDALVLLFGFFAIVDGTLSLIGGVSMIGGGMAWGGPVFGGLLGIAVGIATFVWPGPTALTLLYLIAFWAVCTGIMEIVAAVQLRRDFPHPLLLGFAGALAVVFGILLVADPGAGALSIIWLIGSYAIVFGVSFILLGFRLRGVGQRVSSARDALQGA
jgi:uncharacterized membrane protein HdeD (DUF308 family)